MSLQQYVFIEKTKVSTRNQWQEAKNKLSYDLKIAPEIYTASGKKDKALDGMRWGWIYITIVKDVQE